MNWDHLKGTKITVGKLHAILPPHLQKKRLRTWCGRFLSDVDWTYDWQKATCRSCRRARKSFERNIVAAADKGINYKRR